MKDHYVSYECAQALKRLGFDWYVRGYYTRDDNFQKVWEVTALNHNDTKKFKNILSAPRLDQAQAWLREDKGWDVTSIPTLAKYGEKKYRWDVCHWSKPEYGDCSDGIFDTYEQAISAGISKALELLGKEVDNGM